MNIPAKERILIAAEKLFTTKGYENVSVREIAKEADTSHTSIYVYYKNKRQLLTSLAAPPLEQLLHELKQEKSVLQMAKHYVKFGLSHRLVYELVIIQHASRVDEQSEDFLNQLRLSLFAQFRTAVSQESKSDEDTLTITRMLFYLLHGTIMTYVYSEESSEQIEARVLPLVEVAVQKIMRGESMFGTYCEIGVQLWIENKRMDCETEKRSRSCGYRDWINEKFNYETG